MESLRRLFRMKRVEGEMMLARGFSLDEVHVMKKDRTWVATNLSGFQHPAATFDDFLRFREASGLFGSREEFSSIYTTPDKSRKIIVLYLTSEPGKKVAKADFAIVHTFIAAAAYRHIILVSENGLNADNSSYVNNRVAGFRIELFLDIDLSFNRTKHALCPIQVRHVPASQVKGYSNEEGIQSEKLPLIYDKDPISKWFGAEPGDVFQEENLSTENDTAGNYRRVRQTPSDKNA